ncbi:MAG: SPOR domain-containing protein [Gammaproteobacteria bacterium]|nr:SPOR domain-containing protein [Gammaproteobacteria bacterium]
MLTEQTRYRVTGAVFLFALTAIFLPMLFDGDGIEPLDLPSVPHPQMSPPTYTEAPDMSQTLAGRDQLLAEIDSEGFSRSTGTRIGEPVLKVDDDNPDTVVAAWAVQLASFAKRENAVALRDQLLKDGYESLLSSVKRAEQTRTRVAVGPLINKADARALKKQLAEQYDLDALIVEFSY